MHEASYFIPLNKKNFERLRLKKYLEVSNLNAYIFPSKFLLYHSKKNGVVALPLIC